MNLSYIDRFIRIGDGGSIPTDECMARLRRFEAFMSVSVDLVEVILDPSSVVEVFKNDYSYGVEHYSDNLDKHREIWEMIPHCGRVTAFLYKGIPIVMAEIYMSASGLQEYLNVSGLAAYLVPINISPYCGSWNPNKGALPGTQSFLYTKVIHKSYLGELAALIEKAAKLQPDWNSLEGGRS
jgi:hypothetical protein